LLDSGRMTARDLTIGVIGGLGPEAAVDFFAKLVKATPAKIDQEHLRILIDNNPKVPNRNDAIAGKGPSPAPHLAEAARGLARAGADFVVMACNTAHAFEREIRAACPVPFVSMIEETADEVARRFQGAGAIGVIAAAGCVDAGLYQNALAARGFRCLVPEGDLRAQFMDLVYRIKAGDTGPSVAAGMRRIGEALIAQGAEAIVAGCTEVPLVLAPDALSRPLLDATDHLARRAVAYARRELELPKQSRPAA
jgi:aspartate racemase